MESNRNTKVSSKNICLGTIHALGTFLFVFFMLGSTFVFTAGITTSRWLLPYFILPAYLVSITFGSEYWIGRDPVRRWSYCFSIMITSIVLLPQTAFSIPSYATMPLFRMVLSLILSVFLIVYGILKVRNHKETDQQTVLNEKAVRQQKIQIFRGKVVRFVCLISFCCVFLENSHRTITTLYGLAILQIDSIYFSTFAQFPLVILSAILLARFMKAEFVQWKPSPDGETK